MVSYLDLLNNGRKRNSNAPLTVSTLESASSGNLSNLQIIDSAITEAYGIAQDWDFHDYFQEVVLNTGNNIVPVSGLSQFDINGIKEVKVNISGANKKPITAMSPDEADTLLPNAQNAMPKAFYNQGSVLKVFPAPDQAYTLTIYYQGLIEDITLDNIKTSVVLPKLAREGVELLVYSMLLQEDGDPEWRDQWRLGQDKIQAAFRRNKYPYRRKGLNKFRVHLK